MPTLLELSREIASKAEGWPKGLTDLERRDAADRWSRTYAESMGLDYAEVEELGRMFCHEVNEQTIEAFSRGIPSGIAVDTATFGAVVASLLVAAAKVSGIDPPDELPDLYEEHPLVQGGGWICGHGRIVRVLGIDSRDRVAYEVDGALASHERRPTVDAFLDHYTRIDDVPELGGEG